MKQVVLEKYHCMGNDYLVFDPNKNDLELNAENSKKMCSRHFGSGADGVAEELNGAGADADAFGVVNIVVAALAFAYGHGQSSFSGSSGQSVRSITMISGGCGVSL